MAIISKYIYNIILYYHEMWNLESFKKSSKLRNNQVSKVSWGILNSPINMISIQLKFIKEISKNFNKLCKYLFIFELNRFHSNISISKYKFRDL